MIISYGRDLSGNQFDGPLPDMANFTSLMLLNVSNSGLSGSFSVISSFQSLLSADSLWLLVEFSLPPVFKSSDFPSLYTLSLANTGLESVSPLCQLGVVDLDVSYNRIEGLELCVGSMSLVRSLDLSGNPLLGLDVLPLGLLELRLANASLKTVPAAVGVLSYRS
jgi:hypothetical protein